MKETRLIMGMPVIVEIKDDSADDNIMSRVFGYFNYIDEKFSTYKAESEISKINNGDLLIENSSQDMKEIFALAKKTKEETNGYFDIINTDKKYDPSGIVKGWAILNASKIILNEGFSNFYVEAGGDIQVNGSAEDNNGWKVGIRNPFNVKEIVKMVYLKNNEGIATSGSYERGSHVYNPKDKSDLLSEIVSITVIGPNIYEADRFATAAYAMQEKGIYFIEKLNGFEAYMIDKNGKATMTTGFENYLKIVCLNS